MATALHLLGCLFQQVNAGNVFLSLLINISSSSVLDVLMLICPILESKRDFNENQRYAITLNFRDHTGCKY